MERPPESLKTFADRIARVAASDDATQLIRLLRLSGLMGSQQIAAPDTIDTTPAEHEHVGIWERKTENGRTSFVRRLETMNEWHFWANLGSIEAKGAKRRVLLIGESVARGYFYDPDFSPALALQMILDAQFGENEIEVIDLARTNLGYEVRDLAISALQLEPDIAIIFAGNNWGVSVPKFAEIAESDRALMSEGMPGLKRSCDEYVARTSRRVANEIATAYKNSGVPLVWIIPEFNLGDWRDPITNAPYLPGDLNREWLNLLDEAQTALKDGNGERAEQLAGRMHEIDQGVVAAAYYILADCRQLANDTEGQRKYLELARDAANWDSSMTYVPKTFSMTQEILRAEMAQHGFQTVDLPALFKQYLNGQLPDRRLFLDYCHLTTEGIQIAMGAAASCVLRSLKGVEVPWFALVDEKVAASPSTEAEASMLAAIHDAHRWQSFDFVRHYCRRAVKYSPHAAELMLNYLELQTRNSAPVQMSEADGEIFRIGSPVIHRYLFRNNDKRIDRMLLQAMIDALEEAGIAASARLEELRREEHSVRSNDVDLLDYYYYSSADRPQELEALMWSGYRLTYDVRYFRAFWPESKFIFIGEAGHPVSLRLTCRLPKPAPREGQISIEFNDKPQGEIVSNTDWTTWEINLTGESVRDGFNEVVLHWPMPVFETDAALGRVTMQLCQQKFPDFYPVFGEIHTFSASHGAEVPADIPVDQPELAAAQVS